MPDHSRRMVESSSPPRSSLMTPAQHRQMAAALRRDLANDPETPDLAQAHEQIARALELRSSKAG